MRHYSNAPWHAACVIAPFVVLMSGPVMALPPDPQRPFDAQDCPTALARLTEALAGNPLISANEAADVIVQARAQAGRLCPEHDLPEASTIAPAPDLTTKPILKSETD